MKENKKHQYKVINHLYLGDHGILYDYLYDPYTKQKITQIPENDYIRALELFFKKELSLYQSFTIIETYESDADISAESHEVLYQFCFEQSKSIISKNLDRIQTPYFSEKVELFKEKLNTLSIEDFIEMSVIRIINLSQK